MSFSSALKWYILRRPSWRPML